MLGVMPPYEVTRIVRYAGFEPLAPPLREGTTYVLRATDFRGILMRVVVDARSGAIRAVNRIVPGPAFGGPVGMATPYGVSPTYGGPPRYAMPPPYGPEGFDDIVVEPEEMPTAMPPHGAHPAAPSPPPLPRPRPAELAARKPADEVKPTVTASPTASSSAANSSPGNSAATKPPSMPAASPGAKAAPIND